MQRFMPFERNTSKSPGIKNGEVTSSLGKYRSDDGADLTARRIQDVHIPPQCRDSSHKRKRRFFSERRPQMLMTVCQETGLPIAMISSSLGYICS